MVLDWILFFPSIISSSPPFRLVLDLIVLLTNFPPSHSLLLILSNSPPFRLVLDWIFPSFHQFFIDQFSSARHHLGWSWIELLSFVKSLFQIATIEVGPGQEIVFVQGFLPLFIHSFSSNFLHSHSISFYFIPGRHHWGWSWFESFSGPVFALSFVFPPLFRFDRDRNFWRSSSSTSSLQILNIFIHLSRLPPLRLVLDLV